MISECNIRPQWSCSQGSLWGSALSARDSSTRSAGSSAAPSDSGYGSSPLESSSTRTLSDENCSVRPSSIASLPLPSDDLDAAAPFETCGGAYRAGSGVDAWVATLQDTQLPAVPVEQRQHPRRTAPIGPSYYCPQRFLPCTLTRQDDRAEGFVALLVAFTSGLVEAIWPLSACPPRSDSRFYGGGVLPLKTFIQETLRRSKTSYSTLQVALFYLILLKPHLPGGDLTKEQPKGDDCRAMQCGRRMFLSALILASKYLQDRNYSTRAWSKISGLRTVEINRNEMQYLTAIQWKLHVPKATFDRWSRIVLRLSAQPSKELLEYSHCSNLAEAVGWSNLLPRMTPDLLEDFSELETGLNTPPVSPPSDAFGCSGRDDEPYSSPLDDKTPTERTSTVYSEPITFTPQSADFSAPPQPPMPRLENLPTPKTTPQMSSVPKFCGAPAAGATKTNTRCQDAMAIISRGRRECMARATLDRCPPPAPLPYGRHPVPCSIRRRLSPTSSVSSQGSSPAISESDTFSRSARSRSSSLSASGLSVAFSDMLGSSQRPSASCEPTGTEYVKIVTAESASDPWTVSWPKIAELHGTSDTRSLAEMEAAGVLCSMTKTPTRPAPDLSRQASSEGTPKASQCNKKNIGPSKSHKRTHSRLNDALQDQVRTHLLSGSGKSAQVSPDPMEVDSVSNSTPIHKEPRLPYRDWACGRKPVTVPETQHSKRFAVESYMSAPQLANMFLRRDVQSMVEAS